MAYIAVLLTFRVCQAEGSLAESSDLTKKYSPDEESGRDMAVKNYIELCQPGRRTAD